MKRPSLHILTAALLLNLVVAPALATSPTVELTGGGFGHAVGMTQYGAQAMALAGFDAEEIVTYYYTGVDLTQVDDALPANSTILQRPEPVWVGIRQGVDDFEFEVTEGAPEMCHVDTECPLDVELAEGDIVDIQVIDDDTCQALVDGEFVGEPGGCSFDVTLTTEDRILSTDTGNEYGHGTLHTRLDDPDTFHVSISLELEDYLLGIAETFNWWDPATLEAQALAARSYAVAKFQVRELDGWQDPDPEPVLSASREALCYCHLLASTSDQNYDGWDQAVSAAWSAAVAATDGTVIKHDAYWGDGGIITAFYSSSSSGVTESFATGFGSTTEYEHLQSVDDPWSIDPSVSNPFAVWSETIDGSDFLDEVNDEYGVGFTEILGVDLVNGPPGAKLKVTGRVNEALQTVTVTGQWLDLTFGLRSSQITDAEFLGGNGELWHQDLGPIDSPVESGDNFAQRVVAGDFDGDGQSDLAVGVPQEDLGSVSDAGSVNVLFGTSSGLTTTDQFLTQDEPGTPGVATADDRFGSALAAGDFNADGYADLAVGIPGDGISGPESGAVQIYMGSGSGLVPTARVHQDTAGVPGAAEAGDEFGSALATGDFDGDGYDDIAVGVASEDIGSRIDAGLVTVVLGSSSGLDFGSSFSWNQNSSGIPGGAESGDRFGFSVAAGDLDGDSKDELIVGVPGEAIGGGSDDGLILVMPGTSSGPSASGSVSIHQATTGVPGSPESGDEFGFSLASGDLDGDGYSDLAVGAPGEAIGAGSDEGLVSVAYGSPALLGGWTSVHQDTPDISGGAETGDRFGESIAVVDASSSTRDDLIVGVPGEDLGSASDAGIVHIIPGTTAGIALASEFSITIEGIGDVTPHSGDRFGSSLDGLYFSGSRYLVVGAPGRDINGIGGAGAFALRGPV